MEALGIPVCSKRPSSATYAAGAKDPSMCTLVGNLVPGNSGSYCCSSYEAANPFSSLGPFSSSFIGDTVLSPMDGSEDTPLYLSGTGRASLKIAITGFCQ